MSTRAGRPSRSAPARTSSHKTGAFSPANTFFCKKGLTSAMPHAIIYKRCGALAQLVARHNGIVEAKGSTPLCSIRHKIRTFSCKGFGFFYLEMNRAHAHSRAAACTDSSAERHANAASPPIAFVRGSNARGEWRRFRLLGALPRALCRFTDRRRPSPSRPRTRQPKYPFAAKTHGEWQR